MKTKNLILVFMVLATNAIAQTDSLRILRAFPITDYMVPLNDSVVVVQLEMPGDLKIEDKQLALVWGVYNNSHDDVVQKGYGKCHLIKGSYYYFTIGHNSSGHSLQTGDLLYTFMPKNGIYYGQIPALASHFIRLKNVHDEFFFDRYNIFLNWTETDEGKLVDSLVEDIRFTGKYFLQNESSMNKPVLSGAYQGRKILDIMADCNAGDVKTFLYYVMARPRLYAGREWKIAEIFATWVTEGAPVVQETSKDQK